MFREKFKFYKKKCPPPDLDFVLNPLTDRDLKNFRQITLNEFSDNGGELGFVANEHWRAFELLSHPGLCIIKNPFTPSGQRFWIRKCLEEYPRFPNKNNLLPHGLLSPEDDWWSICNSNVTRRDKIYKQMRWVTLGYHHDWDSKVYSEKLKSKFPSKLNILCKEIGKQVGGWEVEAQAAIINYYHMDSTLSGHTDHSEPNNLAPLFSFSFGQNAIFLIGGQTLDDYTSELLLESGDCVVMSGSSRLCYHGVPKILKANHRPWFENNLPDEWSPFEEYLTESRININVRQVLHPGQTCL